MKVLEYGEDILWLERARPFPKTPDPYIVRLKALRDGFAVHCGFHDPVVGGLWAGALFVTKQQAEAYMSKYVPDGTAFVTTVSHRCLRRHGHYYYMVSSDGGVVRKKMEHWLLFSEGAEGK